MDTGDLIARELKLGRDRLLPEFTYLDQRGIGLWDSNEEELIRPAIWAMDKLEADKEGFGGKPPANTDGTPNDSLHDQFTRLRQFLSLQETRTAGETILVIFPDGTGPALLSCMIAGIPFSEVHALEFQPGEIRTDITVASVKELYEARIGETITSVDIVDTENLIGRCVVAGNVRRSAALALGQHDDREYLTMKNDQEKLVLPANKHKRCLNQSEL